MITRFKAEWIKSDGDQGDDCFNPDLVEYAHKICATPKDATAVARKHAEKGPCHYWFRVEEQVYRPYIYKGIDIGQWDTVATWVEDQYLGDNYDN